MSGKMIGDKFFEICKSTWNGALSLWNQISLKKDIMLERELPELINWSKVLFGKSRIIL